MSARKEFGSLFQVPGHKLQALVLLFLAIFCGWADCSAQMPLSGPDGDLTGSGQKSVADPGSRKKFKEKQLLVKFRATVSEEKKAKIHKEHGSTRIKTFSALRLHQVGLRTDLPVEDAMRLYQARPEVEYAEPNYLARTLAAEPIVPDDPLFDKLWGLHNTGQTGGTAGADIGMPEAWKASTGSGEVVVAVIDTGIDTEHEDLAANIWVNPFETGGNGSDDDGNGYIDDLHGINAITGNGDCSDDFGHGTHVAGIIGAVGNNSLGVTGVNWDVRVLGCKFLNAAGVGYVSEAVACFEYVRKLKANGVNVIATNNSWGAAGYSRALYDAIRLQMEHGILLVAAAGNYGMDNDLNDFFPATYDLPNIISVGASDHAGQIASFSNYGRRTVHIGAPGVDIVSLRGEGTDIYQDGRHFVPPDDPAARYYRAAGTSMAAPHATGLAALIKAADAARDWKATKNLLLSGGGNASSMTGKTVSGKILSASGSLTCVNSPLFSPLKYPDGSYRAGYPAVVSAHSATCASPVGPVTVTTTGGEIVELKDDGSVPDLAAHDGIFTGEWTPVRASEVLTFSSPLGSLTTERVPALKIITTYQPSGRKGYWYGSSVQAAGGLAPYSWRIARGALPPGLSLDTAAGTISGIPELESIFTFTVEVTDAELKTVGRSFSIGIGNVTAGAMAFKVWSRMDQLECAAAARSRDIAVDADGNAYVIGYSCTEFLRKINFDGNVEWTRTYSGTGYAVTTDAAGSVYVAGSVAGRTGPDFFISRYDQDGNLAWTRTYDSGATDYAEGAAVDGMGNLYLAGNSGNGCFLVKYDPEGALAWGRSCGSGTAAAVAVDTGGNILVTGTSGGSYRTARYDADANLLWEKSYREGSASAAQGIAADSFGNVYVAGYAHNGATTMWITLKYDSGGQLLWASPFKGPSSVTYAYEIAADRSGNSYVAGNAGTWSSGVLAMYDTNGNLVWTKGTGVMEDDRGATFTPYAVSLSGSGDIYVTGYGPFDSAFSTSRYSQHYTIVTQVLPIAFSTHSGGYSTRLTAVGGTAPYDWKISNRTLPAGMLLNAATGEISGVPSTPGGHEFTVEATDQDDRRTSRGFALTVQESPVITASAGPNGDMEPSGTVPVPYGGSRTFAITPKDGYHVAEVTVDGISAGAVSSYTFSDVTANHVISASFAVNTYTLTATATGNGSITPAGSVTVTHGESRTFTITPNAGHRIADVLVDPGVSVGKVLSYTFSTISADHWITAGFEPDTYTVTASAGPNGNISPSGAVTVRPGESRTFTMTADAGYQLLEVLVDGNSLGAGYYGSPGATYTFSGISTDHAILAAFCNPLAIAPFQAPSGTVGEAYGFALTATGGKPPYHSWLITDGTLPPGLLLDSSSGVISGAPSAVGSFTFTVRLSDSFGYAAAQSASITVTLPPLAITTAGLPIGYFRTAYSHSLSATGGTLPYTWKITGGSLPCCLSLDDTTGTITGTPYLTGTRSLTAEVTDASASSLTTPLAIQIVPQLAIARGPLSSGAVGTPYSEMLSASGGQEPYTWAVSGGALPDGLTLDAGSGMISGTPAATGTFSFTAQATDDNNVAATRAFWVTVKSMRRQ